MTAKEIIESIEKQIPKKPDYEGDGYDENGNFVGGYRWGRIFMLQESLQCLFKQAFDRYCHFNCRFGICSICILY